MGGRVSSGLLIDQNCASLPIPKLFPKVGKPQVLIHKLDSTPAYSTDMPRWECFWYQGLGDGLQGRYDTHFKPAGDTIISSRGMRIDTYCWIGKAGFNVKLYLWHVLFLTVFAFGLLVFFRILISMLKRTKWWFKIQRAEPEFQAPPDFHPKFPSAKWKGQVNLILPCPLPSFSDYKNPAPKPFSTRSPLWSSEL